MTSLIGNATVDGTDFLTIPDGYRTWTGSVSLSATEANASSSGVTTLYPTVTVSGSPIFPATGNGTVVAELAVATPTINLLGLLQAATSSDITVPDIEITSGATGTGNVYLKLNTAGVSAVSAVASGDLQ